MTGKLLAAIFAGAVLVAAGPAIDPKPAVTTPDGWQSAASRAEIAPEFSFRPAGGPGGGAILMLKAGAREGIDGHWERTVPVEGGKYYQFQAWRRVHGVEWVQQSGLATVQWLTAEGKVAVDDRELVPNYLNGFTATAPREFPLDGETGPDGWQKLSGRWQAPSGATQALIKLHLRWASNATVEWSGAKLEQISTPAPRKVRLASIHLRPRGATPEKNRELFAPLIEEAARQKADLVVLPETLTFYGKSLTPAEVAEPMPGPSTEYFGRLAREHGLYIVAGLYEKRDHLVYNVAALIAPDGKLAGVYRKVTLPENEADSGVAPGREYPVFDTSFGKLGIMICYDGFFPEVARELSKRGAEVIAWPVWGANPELARARAAENHVYLISSTYEDISRNWMYTAIWDHVGNRIATAQDWGSVVVAEVDLEETTRWRSLGDFRSKLPRHVPLIDAAKQYE